MSGEASDLTSLFAPPAPGPAQAVQYRQGVVQTFNPITLENTVLVGGTVLTNLPILGVGEATLLDAGSVVGVMNIAAAEGAQSWAIIGRLVIPNTADAFDAISLMSADTAAAFAGSGATTTNPLYQPGNGPAVTVNVRNTGRVLALWGAAVNWEPTPILASAFGGGAMSLNLTGANVLPPDDARSLSFDSEITLTGSGVTIDHYQNHQVAFTYLFSGLSPGPTTFEAWYRSVLNVNVSFVNCTLAVIVL